VAAAIVLREHTEEHRMKTRKSRYLYTAAIVAALCALVLTAAWAALSKGAKAPDFKLRSIDGKTLTLSQIRKDPNKKGAYRVVLLDFWKTTCPPCLTELPHYQAFSQKYGSKGLAVVGIALDPGGVSDVKPFVQQQKLTYTMLVDPDGIAAGPYGVRYTPTTFIIDKKGIIQAAYVGYMPGLEQTMENQIKALLK
jgi:peroxiredoxin